MASRVPHIVVLLELRVLGSARRVCRCRWTGLDAELVQRRRGEEGREECTTWCGVLLLVWSEMIGLQEEDSTGLGSVAQWTEVD